MVTTAMVHELLARGEDDWVMAAEVAWIAKSLGDAESEDDVRRLGTRLVRDVLEDGLMRIGTVTDGGFLEWDETPAEAAARVEREWAALGRSPEMGELFWLMNTPQGGRRAREGTRTT